MSLLDRAAVPRNGFPERVNYAYRGTGRDQKPYLRAEDLEPYRGGYEQWLPEFARGLNRPRNSADACPGCGYRRGTGKCRNLCGAP